jgi:hypothetical protein
VRQERRDGGYVTSCCVNNFTLNGALSQPAI